MLLPWQHFCLEWFANEKWSNQQTCLKSNTAAIFQWITFISETIRDYVWVNFKPDHPADDPRGFERSHCPGVGFSPNFFAQVVGVSNSRNFLQFWKKNEEISRFVSKKLEAAW